MANELANAGEGNNTTHGSRLDVEELGQSLISFQLRQENDKLRQAVDVMCQAHTRLSEDLTLKNNEITHLKSCYSNLKLQAAELSEKVNLLELELAEFKDSSHCTELSVECARVNHAELPCEVDRYTYSVQQKQMIVSSLQEVLTAEREKVQLLAEQLAAEQSKVISQQTEVVAASARNSDLTAQNTDLQHKLRLSEEEHLNLQLSLNKLREKAESGNGELQNQFMCLQNEYQLQLQSIKVSKEKYEILQQHCDQLTTSLSAEREKIQLLAEQLAEERSKVISQQTEVVAASARNSDLTVQNTDLQHKLKLSEEERINRQLSLNKLHEKAESDNKELRNQLLYLQNEYQLQLQSIKVSEEKYEVLQQQCDQLTTENAHLQLQVHKDESKKAELQAKIDNLEQSLQHNEKVLIESRTVMEDYLSEKAEVQKDLLNAENETDGLRIELTDISAQCRDMEKSLLEARERLVQRSQQIEEKDRDLSCVRQQIADLRETMLALQQELIREQSEKTERKQKMNKLQKEIENLKEIVENQNGTIVCAVAAKEECDKQTAVLQLQTEHLTSEKVTLEHQARILEDHNSSLQKDLAIVTDIYETTKKRSTELQLRVDQLSAREQSLSEQLQRRDEDIQQLTSEKEEANQSLAAVKLKADDDALARTAHVKQIVELEEQIGSVTEQNERLSAEKQVLLYDVNECKEHIRQLKQSFSDSERENERCQKIISDFEEQLLHWQNEKLYLEGRITADMEEEVHAIKENQNVERTRISNLPLVKNTENVEVSPSNPSDTEGHQKLKEYELTQTVEAVEHKFEESEIQKNINSACALVHHLCPEPDSGNLRECDECDVQPEVYQVHSIEKFPSETEKGNLKSDNAVVTQENGHFELMVEEAMETVDAGEKLMSEKSVAREFSGTDKNKQCHPNLVTSSESLLAVADSHEGINSGIVEGGSVKEDPFATENVTHSSDVVQKERDFGFAVTDAANKHKKRRVIGRFIRLPQSSATLRHDGKPLCVHNSNVPSVDAKTSGSCNLDAAAEAVEQLPDNKGVQSIEASATIMSETTSSIELQENSDGIPTSVSSVGVDSDKADVCSVNVCSAIEAISYDCSSAGEQASCLQTVSGCSQQAADGFCQQDDNRTQNIEPECTVTLNNIVNNNPSSDNTSKLALNSSSKRLNTDAIANHDDAKKLRPG